MKVLVAGATGSVGSRLVPQLVERGHEVVGTSRSAASGDRLRALGATPVVLDVLDPGETREVVASAKPDAIVHEATALAGKNDLKHFDESFAGTNRLRTAGTDNLLSAARESGVTCVVAQSYAGWPYAREGGPVKDEDARFDPHPPKGTVATHAAIVRLEQLVTAAGGIVLRYGGFYGPGSGMARDGEQVALVRRRKLPLVGDGGGVWSFLHTDDIATGTLAAIERGRPGEIYHIVDDEPAPVRDWLPALAEAAGAPPPRRVPAWLARLVAGPAAVAMMTEARGASNAKARRELGWEPVWPTWREGFPALFAAAPDPRAHAASSS
jgi:nucleoside-diphosphate-sugar epimerase